MNGKRFFLGAIALSALTSMSAPITPEEALGRLGSETHKLARSGKSVSKLRLVNTSYTSAGEVSTYLFQEDSDKGYVLLSADDAAYPVLGYSDDDNFDAENIPEAMLWWIGEYGRQIEYARNKGVTSGQKVPEYYSEWTPISPMLTTKWNQDAPYNNSCPLLDGKSTYTGCVATSMAQVMNYFKYPEIGQGSIQYTPSGIGRRLSLSFERQAFDWNNMLDVYTKGGYTDEQAAAVSYLMKACGYSVKMNYTADASGAQGQAVASSAVTYFKYDEGAHSKFRDIYPTSEWTRMVYENLSKVGPMVMNGQAPDGGHSFVCDGYDGKGYFHFNWGWGGSSDGYFALDALSPAGIGIGGYEGGFNYDQDAIFGMQPPTGEPAVVSYANLYLYGCAVGEINGNTLSISAVGGDMNGWGNVTSYDIIVGIAAGIESLDGGDQTIVSAKIANQETLNLPIATYVSSKSAKFVVTLPNLQDGEYRVTMMTQDKKVENAPWQPVQVTWTYPNSVKLIVRDGEYQVEDISIPTIKLEDVSASGVIYANMYTYLNGRIVNSNDFELTRAVTAILYDGEQECLSGTAYVVTLLPGEDSAHEWLTRFIPISGYRLTEEKEFSLRLYDMNTNAYYGDFGKVTVKPTPTAGVPVMTGAKFDNSTGTGEFEYNGNSYLNVAFLPSEKLDATFGYKINRGYFDGIITASIYELDPIVPNAIIPVVENFYEDRPLLERNSTNTVELNYDFNDSNEGQLYYLVLRYSNGTSYSSLGMLPFIIGTSGVDDVKMDNEEDVEYYNLQGHRIQYPANGEVVIERKGSSTRKVIFKK